MFLLFPWKKRLQPPLSRLDRNKEMDTQTNLKILIVNDNTSIHADFTKILIPVRHATNLVALEEKLFGSVPNKITALPQFYIDTASQGEEGFLKVKAALEANSPYALAFVDVRMPPGWDGIETIKRIWEIDPQIQIVICTAFSDYSWEETIEQLGMVDNLLILKKPFDNTSVRQLATALTKKWKLLQLVKENTELLEKRVNERTTSLQNSLSLTRSILESSTDGIVAVNSEGKIIDYNHRFLNIWKTSESILTRNNFESFVEYILSNLTQPETYLKKINQLKNNPEEIYADSITFVDGRNFEVYSQPQKLNDQTVGRIWSFCDVTKHVVLEKQLETQATHDALTGLPNRILLQDRLHQAIVEAKRHNALVAVIFFDLDRFKLVNDSFSHQAGDELLKIVSQRLKGLVRDGDTIARLSGDEFVMIIQDLKKEKEILHVAQKILTTIQKPFNLANNNITITSSAGIAIYPHDGETPEVLLRSADLAMYGAKGMGGNRVQLYSSELNISAVTRLEKENDLRRAIKNHEFFLCYQPQVNILNKEIIAVEALVRWNHPKYGVISPLEFIPLAEETGLIVPLGEWVLKEACRQNKIWQESGVGYFRVAVNVASDQLKLTKFARIVMKILNETGLDPKYLEIEVTENVFLNKPEIIKMINQISDLGIQIALDDFGTGNSTLSSLTKVRVDRLKIDRSFIQNINQENNSEVIIQAIIDMSRNLNYDVLAEGVETEVQVEFLKLRKCSSIQGFYFGSPMKAEELETFLKNKSVI